MTETLLRKMSGQDVSASAMKRLTDRELEVFQLIGAGRTTREIAETLNLGVTTVDTYRTRIKEKARVAQWYAAPALCLALCSTRDEQLN